MSMKNREFTANGVKFVIVESNNADWKWQAMRYDTKYNGWVRIMYYANTQSELKEIIKEMY